MARRYDSKEAKRRILTACVRLFLEKGYTNTKVAEILKEADVSAGSFQNIFRTKDGVLTELIGMMFSRQFGAVRPLAANAPSPVYLYAVETALQLAMTELSENLRDIYVEAYTFPATAEIIHRSTTAELQAAFTRMMIVCLTYSLDGTMAAMSGVNRGLGYSMLSAAVTFVGACVFRIIWVYTVFASVGTLESLYVSYPISWILSTAAHIVCYYIIRKKPFRATLEAKAAAA